MTTQSPPSALLPLNTEQLARIQAATTDLSPTQLAWVSGYFWGVLNQQPGAAALTPAPTAVEAPAITLISASQTGNARRVAEALRDDLLAEKLNVNLVNAGDYKFKQIASEKLLVVVASTQGEGEPAEEAVALHKFLFSKKAPKLDATAFAVFGLGDTSYEFFCQSGKDFDSRLAELGAERLLGMYKLVANQPGHGSHVANASFMVDPAAQGVGVGRLMGVHCMEEARRAGYLAMQFNFVVSTNLAAVTLWKKLGFTVVATLPLAYRHAQLGYVDAYVMYQLLTDPMQWPA